MAEKRPPTLPTVGTIAQELGVSIHRVAYVLKTRKHIRPLARVGNVWLYDLTVIAQVRHELNAIDARRSDRSQ